MAIMDPLLNTGFLWRCLAAYAGIKSDTETTTEQTEDDLYYKKLGLFLIRKAKYQSRSFSVQIMGPRQAFLLKKLRESTLTNHHYMSPLRAPDEILRQFPTTYLIVSRVKRIANAQTGRETINTIRFVQQNQ